MALEGQLVTSPRSNQPVELQPSALTLIGRCDANVSDRLCLGVISNGS